MSTVKYPRAIVDEVLRLTAIGYRPRDIEKKLSVPVGTQDKWVEQAGVTRGQALNEKQQALAKSNEESLIEDPGNRAVDTINSMARHLKQIEKSEEKLKEIDETGPGVHFITAYRQLALPRLVDHMDRALKVPPAIKTIRDLEVLDKIVQRIAGVTEGSGGKGSRLHVDVTILERKPGNKPIKATKGEVVDVDEILDGD